MRKDNFIKAVVTERSAAEIQIKLEAKLQQFLLL
jgi:hypothetical protein